MDLNAGTGTSVEAVPGHAGLPVLSEDWMPQLAQFLQTSSAPRFLSLQQLFDLVHSFFSEASAVQLARAVADTLDMNLFSLLAGDLLINEQALVPVEAGERAFRLRPESVVSLQSSFAANEASDVEVEVVYCVIPGDSRAGNDIEIVLTENCRFEFFTLPSSFFPPPLADTGDLFDTTKRYPCFTIEKAFLDMLYLMQTRKNIDLPPLTDFYRKVSRTKLFHLAKQIGFLGRLHFFLTRQTLEKGASSPTISTEVQIWRKNLLDDLLFAWEANPALTFSELLVASQPDNADMQLNNITDQQWRNGITEFIGTAQA